MHAQALTGEIVAVPVFLSRLAFGKEPPGQFGWRQARFSYWNMIAIRARFRWNEEGRFLWGYI
jgi:hypothetical protein